MSEFGRAVANGMTVGDLAARIAMVQGISAVDAEARIMGEIERLSVMYRAGMLTMLDVQRTRDYLHGLTMERAVGMDGSEQQAREHGLGRNPSRHAAEVGAIHVSGSGAFNQIPVNVAAHQRRVIDAARALIEYWVESGSTWTPEVKAVEFELGQYDAALRAAGS